MNLISSQLVSSKDGSRWMHGWDRLLSNDVAKRTHYVNSPGIYELPYYPAQNCCLWFQSYGVFQVAAKSKKQNYI